MLEALGLDDVTTGVYRALLRRPTAFIGELAAECALPAAQVGVIVADLEGAGLLARHSSDPDRLVASPPAMALRPLLLERERGLTRAHEALVELSAVYQQSIGQRNAADVVDVVIGDHAVRQRVGQLQAAALGEVRALVRSDVAVLPADENTEEERALLRGVRYRVIVEVGVLERPGFLAGARESVAAGEEVRVHPALPTRMLIADDRMALLPMHSRDGDRGYGALLVHPSGLLDLVMAIFEEYWSVATELLPAASADDGAAAADRDLLKLLLLGLTDAAIAAQLGVSLRTIQRRVAELMERAKVTTRIQLGAEAVRRSWA